VVSVIGLLIWSYPYDADELLSIEEFGHIGSLIAAIVAPIAVLWVIRGFYVQKQELGAAVEAARAQAKSLSRQIALAEEAHRVSQMPVFFITHQMEQVAEESDYKEEIHAFSVTNSGLGTAYEVYLYVSGKKSGQGYWLDSTDAARQLRSEDLVTFHHDQKMLPESRTQMLLVEIHYRNSAKNKFVDYFQIRANAYGFDANGQQIDQETYFKLMLEDRMAIPSSVNPRSYSKRPVARE
jgi:hypothetical protein